MTFAMTSAAPNVESRYASWLCENNSLSRNVPGWSGKGKHVQFQDREEIDKLLTYWEVLGQGSYAVVQRVTNRKGVPLALKIPRDADKYFEMIMDEVEHLNRLRHPHLVHLVGTFNVRRELSVLLYPAGEWNLKGFMEMIQYTKNPDPDSGEVRGLRKFFKCLSQAIHYIHQNTTKHLDLKPENFIVKQTLGPSENDLYRIFVADFGGAHNFINPDSSQASEKVYTTPVYMSPEIASRQRYGRACDIFSLGAVFTEMLTVSCGHSLEVYQSYRRHEMEDGVISLAYHSNISKVKAWVSSFTIDQTDGLRVITIGDQKIETMILSMLDEVPGNRPKASQLLQYFSGGPCCGDMEAAYKSLVDSDSSDGGDDSDSDGPGDSGGNANNEDWDSNDGDQDDAFFSCSEGDVEDQTDNSHHGDAESQNKISSTYQSQIIARGLLPTRQLEFDWSGRGQHVDFAAGDVVPLTVLNVLDRGRINSVRCRRIKLCRKIIHLRRSGLKYPDEVLNEVEILQRLNHSHIVRLVGSYLQEKRLAVLTYPLADMNLGQLLDDISDNQNYHLTAEQFPLEMSLISGFQCLSHAVSHLHANAVEHMDIKPQNILVKKKRPHPGTEASPVWLPYKLYLCGKYSSPLIRFSRSNKCLLLSRFRICEEIYFD